MTTQLMTSLSIPGVYFGEDQPKPSVCNTCGTVRTYRKHDERTWIREKCGCDIERESQQKASIKRLCDIRRSSLISNSLHDLRIPAEYSNASIEDYQTPRFDRLFDWSTHPSGWWFIHGEVGVGKTHLAFAMLRRAILSGALIVGSGEYDPMEIRRRSAEWIYIPDWVELQRPGHEGAATTELLARVKNAHLLLIDDILPKRMTSPSSYYAERVNSLINDRSNRCLPTIITSNFKLSDIGRLLGETVMSRIRGKSSLFELVGRDRRLMSGGL